MDLKKFMGLQVGGECEIYRLTAPDTPLYCRILDISADWIVADRRAEDGERFGVAMFRSEDIYKVRHNSQRAQKIFSKKVDVKFPAAPLGPLTEEVIKGIDALFGHITIFCEELSDDPCAIGSFEYFSDDIVFIREYRPLGAFERPICAIDVKQITRIEAGGEYEARIISYYNN